MTWPEICKAEGQEGCTSAATIVSAQKHGGGDADLLVKGWAEESKSSFWGCQARPAGHRAPIQWVTAGWCDPGAGSGLSSQTFLILVAFWWRQFLGCGILHIGSIRVVLENQWVSDWRGRSCPFPAALGAFLKSPSWCLFLWPCLDFCEPFNSPQWISFCSKPARGDSGFCNWTLTDTVNYINGFLNTEQFCITGMNSTWVECVLLLKHY